MRQTWVPFLAWMIWAGVLPCLSQLAWADEDTEETPSPVHVSRDKNGVITLGVSNDVQERIGLTVVALQPATHQPHVAAYGGLEADPSLSCIVRAPATGYLRASTDASWPDISATLEQGAVIGTVVPRFGATERFDLMTRWTEATADVEQLTAELASARASYESKKKLNENGRLVSDRALEEAEAVFRGHEARLEAAKKKAEMIERLMKGGSESFDSFALTVPCTGEVVEVPASVGEAVDSGQPLLRVASFEQLVAKVSVMMGDRMPAATDAARIVIPGHDEQVLTGEPMGLAAARNPLTGGPTYLYRVTPDPSWALRPGAPAIAYLPLPGDALAGVVVPRSAVVRLAGLTWVYVETSPGEFQRREVRLDAPLSDGWFATSGVAAGDRVVISGAQLLLSEEQKSQIESEEEALE